MSDIAIAGYSDSKRGCRVAAESRKSSTIIFEIVSEDRVLKNRKKSTYPKDRWIYSGVTICNMQYNPESSSWLGFNHCNPRQKNALDSIEGQHSKCFRISELLSPSEFVQHFDMASPFLVILKADLNSGMPPIEKPDDEIIGQDQYFHAGTGGDRGFDRCWGQKILIHRI
jgi:hypothetical protein